MMKLINWLGRLKEGLNNREMGSSDSEELGLHSQV